MRNTKLIFLMLAGLLIIRPSFAQNTKKPFEPGGKVTSTIFFNYHYDLSKNIEKKSQFELLRAYFGYSYQFSEKLSSKIIFDVANDGKTYATYLRYGGFEWNTNNYLSFEVGMINTHLWDVQEKFFNYRYMLETQQDKDKFYSSGDLGVKATIKPFDNIEFHAGLYNGEGFKKIQDDYGIHKISFDIVAKPIDGLTFKAYYDLMGKKDTLAGQIIALEDQQITCLFIGYEKKDLFRIGMEYNMQINSGHKADRQLNGISAYGAYIYKKLEFFGRFDQLASNTLTAATDPWNIIKDHSLIMGGVQFAPVKGFKMALNYRHYTPRKTSVDPMDLVYLNFEYKF